MPYLRFENEEAQTDLNTKHQIHGTDGYAFPYSNLLVQQKNPEQQQVQLNKQDEVRPLILEHPGPNQA